MDEIGFGWEGHFGLCNGLGVGLSVFLFSIGPARPFSRS